MDITRKIEKWAKDRNFFGEGGATSKQQYIKLIEEAGELAGNLARGRDCKDDIGDIAVVLTIIAKLEGTSLDECMQVAYNDIKNRKGQFVNGIFVKEQYL